MTINNEYEELTKYIKTENKNIKEEDGPKSSDVTPYGFGPTGIGGSIPYLTNQDIEDTDEDTENESLNIDLSEKIMLKMIFYSLLGQLNMIIIIIFLSILPNEQPQSRNDLNIITSIIYKYIMCLAYTLLSILFGMIDLKVVFYISKQLDIIN